ncbi:MAG: hypothetical protein IJZ46_02750 [Bacilli bacterium]|nr:hypothetical protein [Bacilli bacterium]
MSIKEDGIKLIKDNKYISWLEKFTEDNPVFFHDLCFSSFNRNNKENYNNIGFLEVFYTIIDNYAKENYICQEPSVYGRCYQIKYNDIGYEIGIVMGENIIYYCKRTDIKDNFISYDDIKNDKRQERVDMIVEKLELLSNLIYNMAYEGIPVQLISETTEKTVKKILKR